MPTPLSAVRASLSNDCAALLDDASLSARRRSHPQTTSLHLVSALLSRPSSPLRDALSRSRRTSAYRLQYRALDLCFSVALDRLPSSSPHSTELPPLSNSLVAAIKRSQASQRRAYCDPFCQPNQSQLQNQPISSVKVEVQSLILAILDDPVVSRVLSEAGFFSHEIKLAIERPPVSFFPRKSRPPLFLPNLSEPEHGGRPIFPFQLPPEGPEKLADIFLKKKRRNPVLLGMVSGSGDGLVKEFVDSLERGDVEKELKGMEYVSFEEVGGEELGEKVKELERIVVSSSSGVILGLGDLGRLFDQFSNASSVSHGINGLTKLMGVYGSSGRLSLVGLATYEAYLQCQTFYPSMEEDWDLHPLPVSSLRSPFGSLPRSSLMESFVPFGGLFATASDLRGSSVGATNQTTVRCQQCNEKCEQEVAAISTTCSSSLPDQAHPSFPPWLQRANFLQAKDDHAMLDVKVKGLQRKWNEVCYHLHSGTQITKLDNSSKPVKEPKEQVNSSITTNTTGGINSSGLEISQDLQGISMQNISMTSPMEGNYTSSKSNIGLEGHQPWNFSSHTNLGNPERCASSSSVNSVTTDLALGRMYIPRDDGNDDDGLKHVMIAHNERIKDTSDCIPSMTSMSHGHAPMNPVVHLRTSDQPVFRWKTSSQPSLPLKTSDKPANLDVNCYKEVYSALLEKVGRQDKAVLAVSRSVVQSRTGNQRRRGACLRGDVWLTLLGSDHVGKKRIAKALAEIIFGNENSLISVDLSSLEISGYDMRFRGKTVLDHITEEISKKPLSVVFLENVDKADMMVQSGLCQAIRTGKLSNSHRREFSINNAIFVTTAKAAKGKAFMNGKEMFKFSEERIVAAQQWEMEILLDHSSKNQVDHSFGILVDHAKRLVVRNIRESSESWNKCDSPAKRKSRGQTENDASLDSPKKSPRSSVLGFDLNLSAEEIETSHETEHGDDETGSLVENSDTWIDEFLDSVDEVVVLRPFDFDGLANEILEKISEIFRMIVGAKVFMEIDLRVMEQILRAVWLSDESKEFEKWVEQVLGKSLMELHESNDFSDHTVLKLVCENRCLEEQTLGVCLPARINLNVNIRT
ncbi:hypothetical protein AMTRI_Chr08g166710 [Amborella trichopoda]